MTVVRIIIIANSSIQCYWNQWGIENAREKQKKKNFSIIQSKNVIVTNAVGSLSILVFINFNVCDGEKRFFKRKLNRFFWNEKKKQETNSVWDSINFYNEYNKWKSSPFFFFGTVNAVIRNDVKLYCAMPSFMGYYWVFMIKTNVLTTIFFVFFFFKCMAVPCHRINFNIVYNNNVVVVRIIHKYGCHTIDNGKMVWEIFMIISKKNILYFLIPTEHTQCNSYKFKRTDCFLSFTFISF